MKTMDNFVDYSCCVTFIASWMLCKSLSQPVRGHSSWCRTSWRRGWRGQWFGTRWHKNHYVISMLIGYLHNMVFTNHCRANARILKGVMRVGLLAKGLLIRDLLRLELVILTSEKPTKKLLQIVAEEMPEQIKVGVLTWFSFAVGSHWNRSFAGLKWFLCRVCICQTNSSCFCVLGSDAFGYF